MTRGRAVALRRLLAPVSEPLEVLDSCVYQQVTVRTKGRGVVERGVVPGHKIRTKRQFRVRAGQWLVSKIDARNGAMGLVPAALDGAIVTQDFPVFAVDETQCLPAYLAALTSTAAFWDECHFVSEGSTNRVRLNVGRFLDMQIQLPSLDVQRRVTAMVDRARGAEQAARTELDAARILLAAAVERELVEDGGWTNLPDGWRLVELRDVADVRSGVTKGRKTAGPLQLIPFIRAANVQSGFLDLSVMKSIEATVAEIARFRLEAGDVLMIEGGNAEHLGRGWIFKGAAPCLHQNHVFRARPERSVISPEFLAYVITASPARRYCLENAKKTTNLASINKTQISGLPVPLPPLALQREIVARLDTFRAVLVTADRAVRSTEQLRTAIVQSLVNGTLRAPPTDSLVEAA